MATLRRVGESASADDLDDDVLAENRTMVPAIWSTLPSGVLDEAGCVDGAIVGGAGVFVLAGLVGGTTVGTTVGGGLVGTVTVMVGVSGIAVDGDVDVDWACRRRRR